jgi:hypothetical protein
MNYYEVKIEKRMELHNIVMEQKERFNYILDVEFRRLAIVSNFNIVVPHSQDLIKTTREVFRAVFGAHEKMWYAIDNGKIETSVGLDLNELVDSFIPVGDLVECGQVGGYEAEMSCMMNALTEGMNRRFKQKEVDLEVYYKVIDDDEESFYDYVHCVC